MDLNNTEYIVLSEELSGVRIAFDKTTKLFTKETARLQKLIDELNLTWENIIITEEEFKT